MKTRSNILWIICYLLLLNTELMAQSVQKPQVQVTFDITSNNLFHSSFKSDIKSIKIKALTILINQLNNHIGFLEFDKEFEVSTEFHELDITIKKLPGTSGIFSIYILEFRMNGSSSQNELINTVLYEHKDIIAFKNSPQKMLKSFEEKLEEYLNKSANYDLVSKLFKKIPFTLPDSDHFWIGTDTKGAILPFTKNDLNIDFKASIFDVTMSYIDNGVTITKPDTNRHGIGEIKRKFGHLTKEYILIDLETNIDNFLNGKVFISSYIRKIYTPVKPNFNPNAFTNSITD